MNQLKHFTPRAQQLFQYAASVSEEHQIGVQALLLGFSALERKFNRLGRTRHATEALKQVGLIHVWKSDCGDENSIRARFVLPVTQISVEDSIEQLVTATEQIAADLSHRCIDLEHIVLALLGEGGYWGPIDGICKEPRNETLRNLHSAMDHTGNSVG